MSNLADQPLIPCPTIAKYWQSYIKEMTTWWQNQAKSSEMSEMQLLSSGYLITWLPSLREHLFHWAQPSLSGHQSSMAPHTFQSQSPHCRSRSRCSERWWSSWEYKFPVHSTWSNFIFLFTLMSKRCNMTAMFQLMKTASLKCSMNKNKSTVVLNNWTI